jgi:hypothetical protein
VTGISNLARYPAERWSGGSFFAFPYMNAAKGGLCATIEVGDAPPAGTVITCLTPAEPSRVGPRGWASIRHGTVSDGAPPVPIPPRRIGALTRLDDEIALGFRALAGGEANILLDDFLLRDPADASSAALELGVMPRPGPDAYAYAQSGAGRRDLGRFIDARGFAWSATLFPNGYALFLPVDRLMMRGRIDRLAMLRWLIGLSVCSPDLWWTGTALGLEPTAGCTQLTVNRWKPEVA